MVDNVVEYVDFYTGHIDDIYSPTPIEDGQLYLFRNIFYKHVNTLSLPSNTGCNARVRLTDGYCRKCGASITSTASTIAVFYKGKQVSFLNGNALVAAWVNRTHGTALDDIIHTIFDNQGWPLETPVEDFYRVLSYGSSNGVSFPANAMNLHPGNSLTLMWKMQNNSADKIWVRHKLQLRKHADWESWQIRTAADVKEIACVPLNSAIISSIITVPSDWVPECGLDFRIINETGNVIYNLIDETGTKLKLTSP